MQPSQTSPHHDTAAACAIAEQLILRDGVLLPHALLVEQGALEYVDYLRWQQGALPTLDIALRLPLRDTLIILREASARAQQLGLVAKPLPRLTVGEQQLPLRALGDGIAEEENLFFTAHVREPLRGEQLDLFLDAGATPIINALRDAIWLHQREESTPLLALLKTEQPHHPLLPDLAELTEAVNSPRPDDHAPWNALERLAHVTLPAAQRLFDARARDFLAPLWIPWIARCTSRRFDPALPHSHLSWLYAQLGEWRKVINTIDAELKDHADPVLLHRQAEAQSRLREHGPATALWCQIGWRWPEFLRKRLNADNFPDPALREAWLDFQRIDSDHADEADWFPAWLLCRDPGLRRVVSQVDKIHARPACAAFGLIAALMAEEQRSPSHIAADLREQLRRTSPDALRWYLDMRGHNGVF